MVSHRMGQIWEIIGGFAFDAHQKKSVAGLGLARPWEGRCHRGEAWRAIRLRSLSRPVTKRKQEPKRKERPEGRSRYRLLCGPLSGYHLKMSEAASR